MNLKDQVLSYGLQKHRESMFSNSTNRGNIKKDTARIAKVKEYKTKEKVML